MSREERKQGNNTMLIHKKSRKYAWEEQTYDDFVSRAEFINRTGIFVTPEHFGYIYDMIFKKSGVSADEFIRDYEEKYSTCIQEVPLNGTFKYEVMDGDLSGVEEYEEDIEPNIYEIINCLAKSLASEKKAKLETINAYKSVLQEAMQMLERHQLALEPSSALES